MQSSQSPPQYLSQPQAHPYPPPSDPQHLGAAHPHPHQRSRSASPRPSDLKDAATGGYYAPPMGQQGQSGQLGRSYSSQPGMGAQGAGNPLASLGSSSGTISCPKCGWVGPTKTEHESGTCTHIWGICLCVFFCVGCIPYCFNWSKDVRHKCGNCDAPVAMFKRNGSETTTFY